MLKDSLRSQAFLANTIGRWAISKEIEYMAAIGTEEESLRAKEFYYSLYMVWEARQCAEKTLQELLKTTVAKRSDYYSISSKVLTALEAYKNNIFSDENKVNLFGISVSCPVDVEVCKTSGEKILTVKDGTECKGYENGIYYYCIYNPLSDDYDKFLYYSEDSGYNVKIIGNDLGTVDASVTHINENGYLDEYYFENAGIEKGTVIDLYDISKEGADYKTTGVNGTGTANSMEIRKTNKVSTQSISLNTDSMDLEVGEKKLLTVSFLPVNATNQKVAWDSDQDAVVSVNSDGVITALTAGTAVITASQGDLKQTCMVNVKEQNNSSQDNGNGTSSGGSTDINTEQSQNKDGSGDKQSDSDDKNQNGGGSNTQNGSTEKQNTNSSVSPEPDQNQGGHTVTQTESTTAETASEKTTADKPTKVNIKNRKAYKLSKKVVIKDSDGIKSVKLNKKKIKVKSGKKIFSFKLSKYRKHLKKKTKWNKLVVTDLNGKKKSVQFKIK